MISRHVDFPKIQLSKITYLTSHSLSLTAMLFGLHPIYSIGGSAKEAREKWLREMFQSADINNDGLMDEEESISLIKTLSDGVRQGSTDRLVQIAPRFSKFSRSSWS